MSTLALCALCGRNNVIVIFAEYKKFVHIEVKAGEYGAKGSNGSRKERNFTMKF